MGMLPGGPPSPPPAMPPMQPPGNVLQLAPPPPQSIVQQALQLLRRGRQLDYRIEIVSDSMVAPDLQEEQAQRTAFLTATTQFLQQAIPAAEQNPQLLPLMQALLMFGVRGFRAGTEIEGVIEATFEDIKANPPPPKTDPKVEAAKATAQVDAQAKQQDAQIDAQSMQQEYALKLKESQDEMAMKMQELQAKMEAMARETDAKVQAILVEARIKAGVRASEHEADLAMGQQVHEQSMAQQAEAAALAPEAPPG
jgi:hypothetical protein